MIQGRNGPALWTALLDALSVPGAVVAGGCLRDYALNLEPKDIDIFVPVNSIDGFNELISKLNTSFFDGDILKYANDQSEYGAAFCMDDPSCIACGGGAGHPVPALFGVWEGEALGVPVNIIARTSHVGSNALTLVKSFDFCILQQWFVMGDISRTPCCDRDIRNRTATLAHERHLEQSFERWARFNARNPGVLTFKNPFGIDVC